MAFRAACSGIEIQDHTPRPKTLHPDTKNPAPRQQNTPPRHEQPSRHQNTEPGAETQRMSLQLICKKTYSAEASLCRMRIGLCGLSLQTLSRQPGRPYERFSDSDIRVLVDTDAAEMGVGIRDV